MAHVERQLVPVLAEIVCPVNPETATVVLQRIWNFLPLEHVPSGGHVGVDVAVTVVVVVVTENTVVEVVAVAVAVEMVTYVE